MIPALGIFLFCAHLKSSLLRVLSVIKELDAFLLVGVALKYMATPTEKLTIQFFTAVTKTRNGTGRDGTLRNFPVINKKGSI